MKEVLPSLFSKSRISGIWHIFLRYMGNFLFLIDCLLNKISNMKIRISFYLREGVHSAQWIEWCPQNQKLESMLPGSMSERSRQDYATWLIIWVNFLSKVLLKACLFYQCGQNCPILNKNPCQSFKGKFNKI